MEQLNGRLINRAWQWHAHKTGFKKDIDLSYAEWNKYINKYVYEMKKVRKVLWVWFERAKDKYYN